MHHTAIHRQVKNENMVQIKELSKYISHFVITLECKLGAKYLLSGFVVTDFSKLQSVNF